MKTLSTILLSISCLVCQGQYNDSIRIERMEQAIQHMSKNIKQSNRTYTMGIATMAVGVGCIIASTGMTERKSETGKGFVNEQPGHDAVLYGGLAVTFIGAILTTHSRFVLNRAGNIHLTPTGLVIKIE